MALVANLSGCSAFYNKPIISDQSGQDISGTVRATSTTAGQNGQNKFNSLEELKKFLSQNTQTAGNSFGRGGSLMATDAAMPAMSKSAVSAGVVESQKVGNDYTKTNNQVEGVDEADIVKTDGNYLYLVSSDKLRVVSAVPASESKVVAEISLDGYASELFIKDDKLVVFGQSNQFNPEATTTTEATGSVPVSGVGGGAAGAVPNGKMVAPGFIMPRQFSDYAYLREYDITDKANPKILRDLHLEGSYANSRLIGDYIYFVTNKYSYQNSDNPLPRMFSDKLEIGKALPNVYYFNYPYSSYSFTMVSAFNLNDVQAEPNREVYLVSGQEQMYVSENNIYLTHTEYLDEQELLINKTLEIVMTKLTAAERTKVNKIKSIEDDILNKWEKQQKISQILERYSFSLTEAERKSLDGQVKSAIKSEHPRLAEELQATIVHKINIKDGKLGYQGQQKLPGQLINQFSLDENNGNLRLALSKSQTWSSILNEAENRSYSSVVVIDKDLQIVGQLSDIAPGEQIYSARFMDDKVYLVTFERTDPLFVIDLASPSAPRIVGELKLPGYSNYLHPVGPNLILGLGKDVRTNEWGGVIPSSLKLGLFDVADPVSPKEVASYTIGDQGSDSSALYDHKAFLFDKANKLVVIPATLAKKSKDQYDWGRLEFNGSLVFSLDNNTISLKGKIAHTANFDNSYFDYSKAVKRALRINDNLYTISDGSLKINSLPALSEVKSIQFGPVSDQPKAAPFSTLTPEIAPQMIKTLRR